MVKWKLYYLPFFRTIDFNCNSLMNVIRGIGTNEDTLKEIIASRSPEVLKRIRERYQQNFDRNLEEDIKKKLMVHFKIL